MTHPAILILAAGASSRMGGGDKLTEPVAGLPLLRLMAGRALSTGMPVVAVLQPDRPARTQALAGLPLQIVIAADAGRGMSASLRAGLAALPAETPAVMILPADMPAITGEDLHAMAAAWRAFPDAILRGTDTEGRDGHPVLFPADLFPALAALQGDAGARPVVQANRHRLRRVPLPRNHATLDLDTPEDWAAFRATEGSGRE